MPDPAKATLVRQSKIGSELSEEQCGILSDLVELREYADGEIVSQEGAVDDNLRAVIAGALAVAKQSPEGEWIRLNVLTAGDLAGELAFLDSMPRYAALVALGPTKVLSLPRAKLESLLDRQPHLVYHVMRGIARFAHEVMHRSGAQIAELSSYVFKTKAKY
jgi:CRP-like cAMP-binding protein